MLSIHLTLFSLRLFRVLVFVTMYKFRTSFLNIVRIFVILLISLYSTSLGNLGIIKA